MKEIIFLPRRVVVNAILINKNMLIIYVLVTFIANSSLKEKKETQLRILQFPLKANVQRCFKTKFYADT